MTSKFFLLLVLFMGLSACQEKSEKQLSKEQLSHKENIITTDTPLKLNKRASKNVSNWKEYINFKQQFNQFIKITPTDALNNADELNTLAQQLKDSIRINRYKIPAFRARLNVLQSETMRLKDMTTIPNLTENDIKKQIQKILNALNATNAKLNNMVVQQEIEEDIFGIKELKDKVKLLRPKYIK